MRLRDRFQQDSFKPNYNSDTISFTNSQWLQQLLLIAMRLNNASNIHENISSPGNTTSTNSSSSMHIGVDNTTTTTTESTTTGCIILELYDKNPTFLYDQDDFHDIDYSVLKMQIIVWTQKHLKPDDLFMDWFETVNRQIYQNKKIHTKKDHLISQDNELSITNVTFCTENLRNLMIGNDQQIFDEFHTYNLNHDIQYVKNETKSDKYGGNEVQILVVITLCSVLIICFLMAVVLRIRSFCKRQSESRKQMRNDRDSAIQINFPYDVNEIQAVEKLPVPSTTFGSNVPPGPVTKRKGICRYNRIPQSSYNSMQSYNRVFNAQTYQPSTVFVINYHDTDHFKQSHDQYPINNEFHRRYLLHSKQSDNLIHASPNQTINLKSTLKPLKNNVEHQNKTIIKSIGRNKCLNKPIQRTNSF